MKKPFTFTAWLWTYGLCLGLLALGIHSLNVPWLELISQKRWLGILFVSLGQGVHLIFLALLFLLPSGLLYLTYSLASPKEIPSGFF